MRDRKSYVCRDNDAQSAIPSANARNEKPAKPAISSEAIQVCQTYVLAHVFTLDAIAKRTHKERIIHTLAPLAVRAWV